MKAFDATVVIFSFLFMIGGLLFSFWPLLPLGVALLVLYGHTALGITCGLFFDILFGAPVGFFAFLHFPFLLFAVLCVGVRIAALRYVLEKSGLGAL